MEPASIYTIIITAITVLGSASAFKYYEKRSTLKRKTETFMKDDCRERINRLEKLLEKSSEEKDHMREQILALTGEVFQLRVKVEFLAKENGELTTNKPIVRHTTPPRRKK